MRILFMIILGFTVGCATMPEKNKVATTAVDIHTEFTHGLTEVVVKSADTSSKQGCTRGLISLKSGHWKSALTLANTCIQAGNWTAVETVGNHLAKVEHLSPWGAYYLSLAAESRRDFSRAMWMIELALKKAPDSGLLTYQRARISWLSKDQVNAVKGFQKALELNPKLVYAHVLLGQLALVDGNFNEAEKQLQAAVDGGSHQLGVWLGLAEVKFKKGDAKAGAEILSQAIFNYPTSYKARLRQAQVFEKIDKNLSEALTAYRRIRTMDKDRRLDEPVDLDVEGKIRELEAAVKMANPNQLSLREPTGEKKVGK